MVWLRLSVFTETHGSHHVQDFLTVEILQARIGHHVVDTRQVGQFTQNISLDEHGTDFTGIRETLDGTVGNRSHERGLSGIVTTEQTVLGTTLQTQVGVVQENLGTVSEREVTVAEFFGGVIIFLILERQWLDHGLALLGQISNDGSSLAVQFDSQLLDFFPGLGVKLADLHQRAAHVGKMVDKGIGILGLDLGLDGVNDQLVVNVLLTSLLTFHQHVQLVQLTQSTLSDGTSFRIGQSIGSLLQSRQQQSHEGSSINRIVHQLGHVVNDDGRLTHGSWWGEGVGEEMGFYG